MTNLFLAFMVKHAFCDLYFQNKKVSSDKTKYIGECHSHYFDHFLATLLVCYIFLLPLEYCVFLAFIDYVFHWHIDFIKTNIIKLFKLNLMIHPNLIAVSIENPKAFKPLFCELCYFSLSILFSRLY